MYTIIVRNCGANHYATADTLVSAHTLFHALTKTFLAVELWQGMTLIDSYLGPVQQLEKALDSL